MIVRKLEHSGIRDVHRQEIDMHLAISDRRTGSVDAHQVIEECKRMRDWKAEFHEEIAEQMYL